MASTSTKISTKTRTRRPKVETPQATIIDRGQGGATWRIERDHVTRDYNVWGSAENYIGSGRTPDEAYTLLAGYVCPDPR